MAPEEFDPYDEYDDIRGFVSIGPLTTPVCEYPFLFSIYFLEIRNFLYQGRGLITYVHVQNSESALSKSIFSNLPPPL